jgi:putative DNA primase/helicase
MSLRAIVRRLGGDLYDGGRRANIPAPGHSPADRSVSLLEQDGRILIHTFGDGDWRQVREQLGGLGLLGTGAETGRRMERAGRAAADGASRRSVAQALWDQGRPILGTLSERHCRGRGMAGALPGASALRHHPAAPISVYRPGSAVRPALLAGVRDCDGVLSAVEITYLTPGGRRAFDLALPRKTVGVIPVGGAVRLYPPGPRLLVGEGVFTVNAAGRHFGLPAWALLSTSNLRRWRPPPGVSALLIAADRGPDGERSAAVLAEAVREAGVAVEIALPPMPFGDWDDAINGQR